MTVQIVATSIGERLVLDALQIGAIEFVPGLRKIKSERMSPHFFNSGLFSDGISMGILARAFARAIQQSGIQYDVIFGPAYKGTLIVPAVSIFLAEMGLPSKFVCNRKEAKTHGDGGMLIGTQNIQGLRVLILDDVITDGASKQEATDIIRQYGGKVVGLIVAFDRNERNKGGLSALQEFKRDTAPAFAVANMDDLISILQRGASENPAWAEILPKILAYQAEYGV